MGELNKECSDRYGPSLGRTGPSPISEQMNENTDACITLDALLHIYLTSTCCWVLCEGQWVNSTRTVVTGPSPDQTGPSPISEQMEMQMPFYICHLFLGAVLGAVGELNKKCSD